MKDNDESRAVIYETIREGERDESVRLLPVEFSLVPQDRAAPFTDPLDIQPEILSSWLASLEIHPDPRHHKCAFWYCPQGFELRLKVAPDSRFLWLQEGCGWARVGKVGRRFRFEAGDALLIPPGLEHDFVADPETAVRYLSVHFHVQILGGINPLELLGFPRHLTVAEDAPYATAALRMGRESAVRAPGWKQAVSGELFTVLLYVLRHQGSRFSPLGGRKVGRHMLQILPALERIEQRLSDPGLSVEELARSCAVSQVYLRRLFREVIGMSPATFLQRRRIERSCMLLREFQRSIPRIAAECGFSQAPYFHRVFRRWTGTTPLQYRRGG